MSASSIDHTAEAAGAAAAPKAAVAREAPVAPVAPAVIEACTRSDAALARAFTVLGKRWTALVLGCLGPGPGGFREISRAIDGISDSVLSDRLSELTETGLVARTVDEGPPVAVSYQLTASGRALLPALSQLSAWAEEHLPNARGPGC